MKPQVIREPDEIQRRLLSLKREGKTVAVVPTMGALHAGHRALIAEGRRRADVLVVTIFVNPAQFGPNEDLDAYPSTFDADAEICEAEGADFIFFPANEMMYPPAHATTVEVQELGGKLCGASRPVHFKGVTTVVLKLFLITAADVAVFGWKDAQQLLVIRRMARDLNIPVEIVGVETVRDPDGLALSSRNQYLTPDERSEAPVLYRALGEVRRKYEEEGVDDATELRRDIFERLARECSARVDYVEIVSTETLDPLEKIHPGQTLIALAAHFGKARLIDNIRL